MQTRFLLLVSLEISFLLKEAEWGEAQGPFGVGQCISELYLEEIRDGVDDGKRLGYDRYLELCGGEYVHEKVDLIIHDIVGAVGLDAGALAKNFCVIEVEYLVFEAKHGFSFREIKITEVEGRNV